MEMIPLTEEEEEEKGVSSENNCIDDNGRGGVNDETTLQERGPPLNPP